METTLLLGVVKQFLNEHPSAQCLNLTQDQFDNALEILASQGFETEHTRGAFFMRGKNWIASTLTGHLWIDDEDSVITYILMAV